MVLNTPAYCRVGPSTDFEVVTTFMEGEQLDLLGVNPEKTWGKVEKMVKNTLVQCWISLKFLDVFSSEEPVILTVPTLAPQAGPRCTSTLDRTACREAGGTYQEDPPLCRCPRS